MIGTANRPPVVATIGAFDGVHLGHRALLQRVVERAAEIDAASWCVTFFPHPDVVMRPEQNHTYLADPEEQLDLIRAQGIESVRVLEFTREMSGLTAREFIDLLQQERTLVELWIGPDFALGQGRAGTAETLEAIGRELGFVLKLMPPFEFEGEIVSSTRIRQLLAAGEVHRAGLLLGRPYDVRGSVEPGAGRGTPLGFPTANVRPSTDTTLPADGVYVVEATIDSVTWPGVANLGGRPTFGEHERLVEAHLFGFSANLHGKTIRVAFLDRVRGIESFPSVDALVQQIHQDADFARAWFGKRSQGRS